MKSRWWRLRKVRGFYCSCESWVRLRWCEFQSWRRWNECRVIKRKPILGGDVWSRIVAEKPWSTTGQKRPRSVKMCEWVSECDSIWSISMELPETKGCGRKQGTCNWSYEQFATLSPPAHTRAVQLSWSLFVQGQCVCHFHQPRTTRTQFSHYVSVTVLMKLEGFFLFFLSACCGSATSWR